ncbi:unnamed protein product [Clonostachys solani]|uniref:nicotinamidase n=1 Tax=Clonostachys solani TaxID=160281 RepID=A0A9P0EG62_9HYPO|nr:unnamed protein product [Clonostachys solani]
MAPKPFKPALIVVDFQEDFCPPNGSLAVPNGRDISPTVNSLLHLPFPLKLATRDWHPPSHISFSPNHPDTSPFTSSITIHHPTDPSHLPYVTTLWPAHCVAGTPGAQLVPELDAARLHAVLDKGTRPDLEMYSAFYDPFRVEDTGLADRLRALAATHVFVVGLAADYCVRATALHAVQEGYVTYIVEEGTRPVSPEGWPACRRELVDGGVRMVSFDGEEVAAVRALVS